MTNRPDAEVDRRYDLTGEKVDEHKKSMGTWHPQLHESRCGIRQLLQNGFSTTRNTELVLRFPQKNKKNN